MDARLSQVCRAATVAGVSRNPACSIRIKHRRYLMVVSPPQGAAFVFNYGFVTSSEVRCNLLRMIVVIGHRE